MHASCLLRPNFTRPSRRFRSAHVVTGFTLIELLVVVAIIALLISILLPSLARVRFQTKVVACRSNLHDIGTSFAMYAETNKGYYPLTPDVSTDSFRSLWGGPKARTLPNTKVLICPATINVVRSETLELSLYTSPGVKNTALSPEGFQVPISRNLLPPSGPDSDIDHIAYDGPGDATGGVSYEYNGIYNGDPGAPLSDRHKRASHFRNAPHDIMLVHDADDRRTAGPLYPNPGLGCENSVNSDGNNCAQTWDNHGATGTNAMFADSHSDWVRRMPGMIVEVTQVAYGSTAVVAPQKDTNAPFFKLWQKSQYPWRFR